MEQLTFEQLIGAVAVILVMVGAYNAIMGAIKTHREEKARREAPVDELAAHVTAHDEMLARDKRRFEEMDEQLHRMKVESTMTLKGVRALLSHEINGNSTDKLKESMAEIDDYLIQR